MSKKVSKSLKKEKEFAIGDYVGIWSNITKRYVDTGFVVEIWKDPENNKTTNIVVFWKGKRIKGFHHPTTISHVKKHLLNKQ